MARTAAGRAVAGLLIVRCGDTVAEPSGGMNDEGAETRANYLLKWEAISRAAADGARHYDMWGIAHGGIDQFKAGFGGREVRYPGTFDLQTMPLLRPGLLAARRTWVSVARRRRGLATPTAQRRPGTSADERSDRGVTDERRIEGAELLAVGAELLVGDTQDTNSGDIARELTTLGVEVLRISALPDRLEVVAGALRDALAHADLVMTTGGLGPTPDDLTREAIALVCDETVAIDPDIERWIKGLFDRRGIRYSEANRKQAWLIPSASSLAKSQRNGAGLVGRPARRPGHRGPARDRRARCARCGATRSCRAWWLAVWVPTGPSRRSGCQGMGESLLVDAIGEDVLRRRNPEVATYARVDAVDVRVSAIAEGGRTARELVDEEVATADAGSRPICLRPRRRRLASCRRSTAGRPHAWPSRSPGRPASSWPCWGRSPGWCSTRPSGRTVRSPWRIPTRPSSPPTCGGWAARTSVSACARWSRPVTCR